MSKITVHIDTEIGLTMKGVTFQHLKNHGKPCWKATQPIGSIFGSEVHGEISAYGATKEICLERLREERKKLAESLWA